MLCAYGGMWWLWEWEGVRVLYIDIHAPYSLCICVVFEKSSCVPKTIVAAHTVHIHDIDLYKSSYAGTIFNMRRLQVY